MSSEASPRSRKRRPAASRSGSAKALPGSDRIRVEWLRRVEAEYRSAAITQHLVLWLIQIAASPDLLTMGLRIVQDELTHADLSHRTYRAAGGAEAPVLARETLSLSRRGDEPLEHDVLRVCVETFCLGETVAVPLFSALRSACVAPAAKRALDRVLRDEVRHRDFGWLLLGWLLEHPLGPGMRRLIDAELPGMFERVLAAYAADGDAADDAITSEEQAWGLMAVARYGEVLHRCARRDYLPRFAKLGIDGERAWQKAISHQPSAFSLEKAPRG